MFSNDDDVLHMVGMLIKEVRETNAETGVSFDIAQSISSQIGFFACNNVFIKQEYQEDIAMHLYCKEYSIPPYPGPFKKQPRRWTLKSQIIKNALIKMENREKEKVMNKGAINNGK